MAGPKGLYRIFVENLSAADSNNRWHEFAFNDVGDKLKLLFDRVILDRSCPYTYAAWYAGHAGMALDPGEVLVYFVASSSYSLIARAGGRIVTSGHEGMTWFSPTGVISEVWIGGNPQQPLDAPLCDSNYTQLLANCAFHELMHNKLDAAPPPLQAVDDIHVHGGFGLASASFSSNTPLTPTNIQLMARNLARPVPQSTAAANVNMLSISGMPNLINGLPAPSPG